jgi:hypothetical protein
MAIKIVRDDFADIPQDDWICRGPQGNGAPLPHFWDSVSICEDRFRIMKCLDCGIIDPCGCPVEFITL